MSYRRMARVWCLCAAVSRIDRPCTMTTYTGNAMSNDDIYSFRVISGPRQNYVHFGRRSLIGPNGKRKSIRSRNKNILCASNWSQIHNVLCLSLPLSAQNVCWCVLRWSGRRRTAKRSRTVYKWNIMHFAVVYGGFTPFVCVRCIHTHQLPSLRWKPIHFDIVFCNI